MIKDQKEVIENPTFSFNFFIECPIHNRPFWIFSHTKTIFLNLEEKDSGKLSNVFNDEHFM
jgi:hypothetical protein